MASSSSLQRAEAYLLEQNGTSDTVSAARRKALELRAEAGEATLKLSERAVDSADSVLKAAALLQSLAECLHEVQSDIRDSKTQLGKVLEEAGNKTKEKAESSVPSPASVEPSGENTDIQQSGKPDRVSAWYEAKRKDCIRKLAAAATSSSEWLGCLIRTTDVLSSYLQETEQESQGRGWIRRFPNFATRMMKWFVTRHFYALTLMTPMTQVEKLRGESLTEEQWQRLANALQETLAHLDQYGYLFVSAVESSLQMLVANLLQRAKQDMGSPPNPDFEQHAHPLRRALVRVLPCVSASKLISASIGPIILTRCTIYVQEVDRSRTGEVRLAVNNMLITAELCLN